MKQRPLADIAARDETDKTREKRSRTPKTGSQAVSGHRLKLLQFAVEASFDAFVERRD